MTSPRVGVVRESMLTNPLQIKAPLGKTRSRGLMVPGPDFTFGSSSTSVRDGGVAEVLSSWRVQSRQGPSPPPLPFIPDFVSLNRDAVRSGVVTSKELSQFRAQRGVAKWNTNPRALGGGASQHLDIPDITFGVKTRAPSPLSDLLTHEYGRRWLDDQLRRTHEQRRQETATRVKPGAQDTRTTLLRSSVTLPQIHTPVKVPRYTQVGPALDTFRDQNARLRAFRTRQQTQSL